MPELLIKSCGKCPYYHVGEAEIGYKQNKICTFGDVDDWKKIPEDNEYYKVLDDCPLRKRPVTLTVR